VFSEVRRPRRGFSFSCHIAAISPSGIRVLEASSIEFRLYVDSAEVQSDFCGSERDDSEAGDEAEVAEIDGQNREAEGERCSSDQQVCEGDSHALGLLLTVDLSGQHCGLFRVGIDREITEQFLDEGLTAQPPLWGLCAIDAVDEFGQSNPRRERRPDRLPRRLPARSVSRLYLLDARQ
jgi:hypothetical protein